jgi:hypothetical protein
MAQPNLDGVLLEWGSLLYYPEPKKVKAGKDAGLLRLLGANARKPVGAGGVVEIRSRILATVRRAPQVMVKITGGAKGMKALRAHFNYISKRGKLEISDEQGNVTSGKDAVRELGDDWQVSGAYVPEISARKEAFHITLSMPAGTDEQGLQDAVWAFAAKEFADHKYVGVFHGHQANPHVHLVVKVQGRFGRRLNPRKADLQRWREGFAQALRERGIDAQATRQPTHGAVRPDQPIWRASSALGHQNKGLARERSGNPPTARLREALIAWGHVHNALAGSSEPSDRELARHVKSYLEEAPSVKILMERERAERQKERGGREHAGRITPEQTKEGDDGRSAGRG